MSKYPVKITVIGGCHAVGFPLGPSYSFAYICQKTLSPFQETLFEVVGYLDLHRVQKVVEICEMSNPDILVLQLGNYVFNPVIFKGIRKWATAKKKTWSSGTNTSVTISVGVDIDRVLRPDMRFHFFQTSKRLLYPIFFQKTKHLEKCRAYVDAYFDMLEKNTNSKIIVLGAFPAADSVMNKYRRLGNEMLRQKCRQKGYDYLDVFELIQQHFGNSRYTIDNMHLSRSAHVVVGQALAKRINQISSSAPAAASVARRSTPQQVHLNC